ncbi:hypothetical protein V5O48_007912 [Marasmius crinis-equi]|uniref:Uncharacterized protein n=1 Tax=Marasmius crinis-equi TaxID=585013 RepID=A0ABR3FFH0_9AGAR
MKTRFSFSGNVFDYEDPWKAVGLVLGVHKTPETPPRTRDFTAMLAQIPSPNPDSSSPAHENEHQPDSLFSWYSDLEDQMVNDPDDQEVREWMAQTASGSGSHSPEMQLDDHRQQFSGSPTSLFSYFSTMNEDVIKIHEEAAVDARIHSTTEPHPHPECDMPEESTTVHLVDEEEGEEEEQQELSALGSQHPSWVSEEPLLCSTGPQDGSTEDVTRDQVDNYRAAHDSIWETSSAEDSRLTTSLPAHVYPQKQPSPAVFFRSARTPHARRFGPSKKPTFRNTFDDDDEAPSNPFTARPSHRTPSRCPSNKISSTCGRRTIESVSTFLQSTRNSRFQIPSSPAVFPQVPSLDNRQYSQIQNNQNVGIPATIQQIERYPETSPATLHHDQLSSPFQHASSPLRAKVQHASNTLLIQIQNPTPPFGQQHTSTALGFSGSRNRTGTIDAEEMLRTDPDNHQGAQQQPEVAMIEDIACWSGPRLFYDDDIESD